IRACILHAIYTHMEDLKSYTTEASIVKLADGTDITKGRSRLPYDLGNVDIHVISAMSVEDVEIVPGDEKPVEIRIYMTNSAGVFQVEEILYRKLVAGVLTGLVKIVAKTIPEKIETDKRIVRKIVSEKNRFIHIKD
ncbi:MAG: phosphohydrolase, partial [Thermoprotei archaeon]